MPFCQDSVVNMFQMQNDAYKDIKNPNWVHILKNLFPATYKQYQNANCFNNQIKI